MRHTNIVAAFLILVKDNQVLLSRREGTGYHDGDYSLIAGHVEAGETFTQTIIREAKEEAGIELNEAETAVVHVQHRKSDFDASERVDVYFTAKRWNGDIINGEPHKCGQLEWFDVENLPDNMVESVREAIINITKGIPYSEYGWE